MRCCKAAAITCKSFKLGRLSHFNHFLPTFSSTECCLESLCRPVSRILGSRDFRSQTKISDSTPICIVRMIWFMQTPVIWFQKFSNGSAFDTHARTCGSCEVCVCPFLVSWKLARISEVGLKAWTFFSCIYVNYD